MGIRKTTVGCCLVFLFFFAVPLQAERFTSQQHDGTYIFNGGLNADIHNEMNDEVITSARVIFLVNVPNTPEEQRPRVDVQMTQGFALMSITFGQYYFVVQTDLPGLHNQWMPLFADPSTFIARMEAMVPVMRTQVQTANRLRDRRSWALVSGAILLCACFFRIFSNTELEANKQI